MVGLSSTTRIFLAMLLFIWEGPPPVKTLDGKLCDRVFDVGGKVCRNPCAEPSRKLLILRVPNRFEREDARLLRRLMLENSFPRNSRPLCANRIIRPLRRLLTLAQGRDHCTQSAEARILSEWPRRILQGCNETGCNRDP